MAAAAPDRIVADRYALAAPLGRGGMGVVWRAHDRVLGRAVAVKEVVFPPSLPEAERRPAQARVMREARAAARLNHPGAVTIYDVVHAQGHTFIVMELVDAPTLADLIRERGPLAPRRVAEIAGQIAGALEAAHRAGIVHRDVKPGNVMVPEDGGVKLADFGIASLQGDAQLTATGLVIGSPAYMAPEQASGEPSGPPTDFWALGATMYAAVEGEPPFDKGASIPTLAAVVGEDPRPMRLAGPLTPVIAALLTKDPARRPSGPQLRARLQPLAGRTPVGTTPTATDVLPVHREEPPASTTAPLPVVVPDLTPAPPEPTTAPELPHHPPPAPATPPATASAPTPEPPAPAATPPAPAASAPERSATPPALAPEPAPAAERAPAAGGLGPAAEPEAPISSPPPAAAPAVPPAAADAAAAPAAAPAVVAEPTPPAASAEAAPAGPSAAEAGAAAVAEPEAAAPAAEGAAAERREPFPQDALLARPGGSRRGPLVAVVGVLLLAAVLAGSVWLAGAFGSRRDPGAPTSTTGAAATRPGGATTQAPSTQAPTTQAPSTQAPSTQAPAAGQLPAGWTSFSRDGAGYAVGIPAGWRERTRDLFNATVVEEERGDRRFTVRSTNPANPLPAASQQYRDRYARNLPGYRQLRFDENGRYQGRPAVVFEYEAVEDGRRIHISHVNLKGRTWGYNVEFVTPAGQWNGSQELARQFEQAFRPLG
jgi:eukaryotic-like serine/threonine-protein kinase